MTASGYTQCTRWFKSRSLGWSPFQPLNGDFFHHQMVASRIARHRLCMKEKAGFTQPMCWGKCLPLLAIRKACWKSGWWNGGPASFCIFFVVAFLQLMVNWWFGMILGVHPGHNPFHFRGSQESKPPGPKPYQFANTPPTETKGMALKLAKLKFHVPTAKQFQQYQMWILKMILFVHQ